MAQNKLPKTEDPSQQKEDEDHSLLIKPIKVGLSGAHHVLQSIRDGTAEVRDLLLNECEIIYECKMCRSLHRSLVNFLAHKRGYCTAHCCESMMLFTQHDIENETVVVQPESPDSGAAVNEDDAMGDDVDGIADEDADVAENAIQTSTAKIFHSPAGKDKTGQKRVADSAGDDPDDFHSKCVRHLENRKAGRTHTTVKMQKIESNPAAMFQIGVPDNADLDSAVAEKPNHVKAAPRNKPKVAEIAQLPPLPAPAPPPPPAGAVVPAKEAKRYVCNKCGSPFSSMKSMSFHLKNIHAKRRVYYTCPYCKSRFSQVYGVNRHLMSVHKKSKEQVSRLRGKIQKSALLRVVAAEDSPSSEDKLNNNHSKEAAKTSPVQSSSVRLSKGLAINRCPKCDKIFMDKRTLDSHTRRCSDDRKHPPRSGNGGTPDAKEKGSDRPRRAVKKRDEGDFVDGRRPNILANTVASKSDVAAKVPAVVEERILEIVDAEKLLCLQCNKSFMNQSNLRRHAAAHIGWNRFKCKYCGFQSYSRSDIRSHVKKKHITKPRLHKQLDSFVVDVPQEEVEKNMANGTFKLSAELVEKADPEADEPNVKRISEGSDSKSRRVSEGSDTRTKRISDASSSCEEPELSPQQKPAAESPVASRKSSAPLASFNISTRLSPRTFDTSPYRRCDSESVLVTRSGSYPKADVYQRSDSRTSSGTRKELMALQPERKNQKVLRTKVVQLKPSSISPGSAGERSGCGSGSDIGSPPKDITGDTGTSPKDGGSDCSVVFSSYDDHNYSAEVKFLKQQEEECGTAAEEAR